MVARARAILAPPRPIRAPPPGESFVDERVVDGQVVTDASGKNGLPADAASGGPRPGDAAGQAVDDALVEEALGGRLEAFNQLVVRHQDHLFALVYRLVPDRDQAADAVQEAFFNAYRNLASFRGGSVRSWLGRIAVNAAMDIQRARRRRPSQPYPEYEDDSWQPPAETEVEPESKALAAERSKVLARALHRLPVEQRSCIVLFDVEGYGYAEIAEIMHVAVGTVKSRIHRGRLTLRGALAADRELFRG
jgi:RNA polymerase sigma-70 factor (ECF subfamily)